MDSMLLDKLDQFKAKLDSYRPLDSGLVRRLRENLILDWTYNSNAIEGNTLTLQETRVVLEGVTIGGKNIREHLEAINHRDAIGYVEAWVQNEERFSELAIRNLHHLILKGIDEANAGRYRTVNVKIGGAQHVPPSAAEVPSQMAEFVEWNNSLASRSLHAVERAARVHVDFVGIHPFVDGNGRTSRLLMNLELMKAGFPPVVIPVSRRLEYYQTLDHAHTTQDYAPFTQFVAECVQASFEPYWFALGVQA